MAHSLSFKQRTAETKRDMMMEQDSFSKYYWRPAMLCARHRGCSSVKGRKNNQHGWVTYIVDQSVMNEKNQSRDDQIWDLRGDGGVKILARGAREGPNNEWEYFEKEV